MLAFRSLAKSAYRKVLVGRAQRQISELHDSGALPGPLFHALVRTLKTEPAPEELRWLESISALHSELNGINEAIEVVDYGAGSPDEHRTEEQSKSGVAVGLTIAQCSRASKDPFWGKLLFMLVRELRPVNCLELGTNLGISAAYQAAAMTLNGAGRITTLEGAPTLVERAKRNIEHLGLKNVSIVCGRFNDTLDRVLADEGPFDFVFVDGHHDGDATIDYFDRIRPHCTARSTFVFDDIQWSDGMRSAWKHIGEQPGVSVCLGLTNVGICTVDPQTAVARRESIVLV